MLFHTQYFLIFLFIVFSVYYLLKAEGVRRAWLLAASVFFYGFWNIPLIGLLLFSIFLDFFCGKLLYETGKKRYLIFPITINLAVLAFFKYANFGIDSFVYIAGLFGVHVSKSSLNIILPLGISFYTFQLISYVIDMYRRSYKPYERLADFTLYIIFFAHLVAGPIVRADYFKRQLSRPRRLRWHVFYSGIMHFIVGAFKKIVLADQAAAFVNTAFGAPSDYSGPIVLTGVLCFSFQIYFDFSGYTDMARGLAFMFGFHFPENFRYPYTAIGLRDFWRRWHISLSTWLRDYLYIPLGGSKISNLRTYLNLMLTMLLGGLWHGASLNFIIWGGLHGLLLTAENILFRRRSMRSNNFFVRGVGIFLTFLIVSFIWIFFRAENTDKAIAVIKALANTPTAGYWSELGLFKVQNWILGFFLPAFVLLVGIVSPVDKNFKRYPLILSILALLMLMIITIIVSGATGEFIYFQF